MSLVTQPLGSNKTRIADIMSKALVTADSATTVSGAATLMGVNRVGSVLVLDGGGLAGIFTERDIVRACSQHPDGLGDRIEYWMTPKPATVSCCATLEEALDRMLSGGFRHLPVTDATTLVGMVSMRDLCRAGGGVWCTGDCGRGTA